ncbi:hypothetical protein [Deinococcus hopiensis]|uniref:Nucleotidyltransferase n=1 Tax=Deinococcus hopiensis KR-140 TaxID=695939 RepID=A0A1W1UZI3_9DEIO|nr:hypothetical protein [Deinococcus hopiensis]SMB86161.1 hypothetical protein SAMN00790413_03712 [Deinococcus hopiensis KR-140]
MLAALQEAFDDMVLPGHCRGLYFKGSASKAWRSPSDYVPELSDLDLHIWFHHEADVQRWASTEVALRFVERTEAGYLRRVPAPLHWPRPQVMVLNKLLAQEGFARSSVTVLHGEPYPGAVPDPKVDQQTLLRVYTEAQTQGLNFLDKPGPYGWAALRAIHFRLSPTPSRLLSALGAGEWAWQQPRSVLLEELRSRGLEDVAELFERYYRLAWAGYATQWKDGQVLRETTSAGLAALEAAVAALPQNS